MISPRKKIHGAFPLALIPHISPFFPWTSPIFLGEITQLFQPWFRESAMDEPLGRIDVARPLHRADQMLGLWPFFCPKKGGFQGYLSEISGVDMDSMGFFPWFFGYQL